MIKIKHKVEVYTCSVCDGIYACKIDDKFRKCIDCPQFYSRETDCVGIQLGLERHEGYCSFCSKDLN